MTEPAPPVWHAMDLTAVEAALDTSEQGLSSAAALERLQRYGPNQIAEARPFSNLAILLHQFQSPLIYILVLATIVTVLVGEPVDAGVIAAVLVLNAVIGFVQERGAAVSMRALSRLAAPRARVVRGGRALEVRSRELVPGDLVLLESGDRVPADLRLVAANALLVDESLLTGESTPVAKQTRPLDPLADPADRSNIAYSGTVVVSGRGRGYVVATGAATQLGAIAARVQEERSPETPLQRRMAQLSRVIGVAVAVAAVLAFVIGVLRGEAPAQMFLVAVALAVSAVPEGLPVAFTVTLALGVRRMARRNAIIRHLAAVEALGSTTVIGSDKTGTLTENRMTVQEIWAGGRTLSLRDAAQVEQHSPLWLTLLAGVLATHATLTRTPDGFAGQGDPTEVALLAAAARMGIEPEDARAASPALWDLPFEPPQQYGASFRIHRGQPVLFVAGAPERVLSMCAWMATESGAGPLDRTQIQQAAQAMAARGLRVLAMAMRTLPRTPQDGSSPPDLHGLTFLGLQGMLDPPRPGVREAIAGCREAGIRVVMITGDHAATARAVAADLGIAAGAEDVRTGAEIAALDDATLDHVVAETSVYARMTPDQKLRVVQALRRRGETVAVTGDGVNDAPALRAADIGVAMGRGGTDVAREAADMVLADDNFATLYAAVEEGRITFDNVRKVTFFMLSTGVGEVLTIITALALGWPLVFLPAQILWLNLVTDSLQAVALAFEPGDRDVLKRPPRRRDEGILTRRLWERTAIAGSVMAIGTLFLFQWELDRTDSLVQAQTTALTVMVLFQTFHVGNARSQTESVFRRNPLSNPLLLAAAAAALAVHVAALYLPPTQVVLRVEPLDAASWLRIVLVAGTIVLAMELHKRLRPDLRSAPHPQPAA
jgi:calcium-translocating P-type ATPase